jgi:hypothetical protein
VCLFEQFLKLNSLFLLSEPFVVKSVAESRRGVNYAALGVEMKPTTTLCLKHVKRQD